MGQKKSRHEIIVQCEQDGVLYYLHFLRFEARLAPPLACALGVFVPVPELAPPEIAEESVESKPSSETASDLRFVPLSRIFDDLTSSIVLKLE
jgi:hypothetical protein